ncbi:MAG: ComEC/Rec2 family competence protein [Sphingomonadaceae bacterium]
MAKIEQFLDESGFDRAPWLAVAFAAGIAAWFTLPSAVYWSGLIAACLIAAGLAWFGLGRGERYPYLSRAIAAFCLLAALGCATVWTKSALVGAPPIDRPIFATLDATILSREAQPAQDRVRLVLATRLPDRADAVKVRVNVPEEMDRAGLTGGARIRVSARLMPPAPPMLPGAYNFARRAWFDGLVATGSVTAAPVILQEAKVSPLVEGVQARLSSHVRERLASPASGIAATLASGDRGAIPEDDAQAMRDAGLAHLLSISGLHVSAVIAAAYLIALKLLALWPWLALRVRLPVLAAGAGALAGIGYTLLTGAQVPTVRSCIGALLVLIALAIGREALSLRLLAVAAFAVLLLWPESLVGPSFQMSFAAVIAIIGLSTSEPIKRFLGPREEHWARRAARYVAMLFLTGLVIEIVLMPIALHHFHRAGLYGAFANVIAIPLTTVVVMPLIAIALTLDIVGLGAPVWWLAEKAISVLLGIAHGVAAQPGAVKTLPAMGTDAFLLFVIGGLWLALWNGRIRALGLVPAAIGTFLIATLEPPDILVSSDGRHVGITGESETELLVLRDSKSDFVRDNLTELAGMRGETATLADWPGARCNAEFCAVRLNRGGRNWDLLIARGRDRVPERALAASCARADIVIADRWLPRSCQPRWLKADKRMLSQSGGLAIDLDRGTVTSVADHEGAHGWWKLAHQPDARRGQ